ncbi:hypothetical protein D9757_011512 [Collybiopsis confluens]|uniref:Uncharacterized protein n=1 Tax=Collybiopsis confluens TaxID=2823264 RepID=A0A8H5H7H5_9AGAR|nr:hypothetical protein D9757_011512 [Collybiopsis confluens]
MSAIFFACCTRNWTRRRAQPDVENQAVPDEESRLLIPEPETPNTPDVVSQEREMRKARLVTIVRSKEGNMINTSDYAPFNIFNRPYRYSPHRYGPPGGSGSGSGRSLSRSASRGPSRSVVRFGYGHGHGSTYAHGYGSTLINAVSVPAPLDPERSSVQVQIASAALGTTSLERGASKAKTKAKGLGQADGTNPGQSKDSTLQNLNGQRGDDSLRPPSRPRPTLIPQSSSTSSVSSIFKAQKSASPTENNSNPNLEEGEGSGTSGELVSSSSVGLGLGVRLVHPPSSPFSPGVLDLGRRGRPTMKAGLHDLGGDILPSAESSSRLLRPSLLLPPLGKMDPRTVLAPPPSPLVESDSRMNDGGGHSLEAVPVFKIKDAGDLMVGWDD